MRNKIKKLLTGIIVVSLIWPGNSSEWEEVAPEDQGLNSSKISEMFEFINSSQIDIHSVVIVRNGYLITEEYLYSSDIYRNLAGEKEYYGGYKVHMQMSTTKSIIAILIGIALQEGFLDNLSQTLYEFYADIWEPTFTDSELKKNITIEQLLTMNSGLNGGGTGYPSGAKTKLDLDCINFALNEVPLRNPPGSEGVFEYSNDGPNLLSGIIANVTGNSTEEFAREYLFEPLGILEEETFWWNDSKGMDFGGYGFDCSPKVQAKLGMLCLNDGAWNGQQIVEPNFIIDATTPQIYGYGYLIWMVASPFEGYSFIGAGGQCVYVIPEFDLVVGFTASDDPNYFPIITDYILQDIKPPPVNQIPEDQGIPDYYINVITLTIFCTTAVFTTAVLIIRNETNEHNFYST